MGRKPTPGEAFEAPTGFAFQAGGMTVYSADLWVLQNLTLFNQTPNIILLFKSDRKVSLGAPRRIRHKTVSIVQGVSGHSAPSRARRVSSSDNGCGENPNDTAFEMSKERSGGLGAGRSSDICLQGTSFALGMLNAAWTR